MKKRIIAVVMMLVMIIVCPFATQNANAATSYDYLLKAEGTLSYSTETHSFTSSKAQDGYLYVYAKNQVDIGIKLTNTTTSQSVSDAVYASDWKVMDDGWYGYGFSLSLNAASYDIVLQCLETTQYEVYVEVPKETMTINNTSATITAGQKKTLKVKDAPGKVTWKSSKQSVATVSSKGVVKAKKAGKATITATSGGQKVTCKVTVKKNVYTNTKLTMNNSYPNSLSLFVHKAAYKKGKIVCNFNIVNKTSHKIDYFKYITITVKTASGKTIAKQKFNNIKWSMSSYSKKTKSLTISKKKVKKKSADLRNAVVYIEGKGMYTTYYYY